MKLTCLYRISDGSYKKDRLPNATKKHCLENFLGHFGGLYRREWKDNPIIIFADNVTDETYEWLGNYKVEIVRTYSEGNAYAFNMVFDYAVDNLKGYVYFVEDDYLHVNRMGLAGRTVLLEGLLRAHYVSLYDHPDKYIPARMGGNPFIGEDAAEVTKVFKTDSIHWKLTNSTTMTFASSVDVLKEDKPIWKKHTTGPHPNDMHAFLELRKAGRTLATPIPSMSTHCDLPWLAPLVEWREI